MKTKLFSLILTLWVSTSLLFAQSGTCGANGNNLTWTLSNGILTISGTGTMADYPNSSSDRAPWYDYRSSITNVIINSGVTSVGDRAFPGCSSLTSITIPNSVTSIGNRAFYRCSSLTSVTIPNNVTNIGEYAFYYCSSLTSITIPNNVTSIGGAAFFGCSSLTSITIPNSVTSMGFAAFYGCSSLTSITIPSSVANIGGSAFFDCTGLTSITLPNSVTSIGKEAFGNCSKLNAVHISDIAAWCAISFEDDSSNPLCYAHNLYLNGSLVKDLTIPNNVTSIGDNAFYRCTSLASIIIPNSVISIGKEAFSGCSSLTSIRVEQENPIYDSRNNCNAIIETATNTLIAGCQNTVIPNNVTSIGDGAFRGRSSLTSIMIPSSVTSIGGSAFSGCSGLTSITIPNSVTGIGQYAFCGCSGLTSVAIPNSVTSIPDYVFSACTGLTSITIPNNVTSIGDYAFSNCEGLTSVAIPNSVTSIGKSAFLYCCFLTSLTIPNSVTSIGNGAFQNVSNIVYSGTATGAPWGARSLNGYVEGYLVYRDSTKTELLACSSAATGEITISNSVTSIGRYAFWGCISLTSITIPNSVTSIGGSAFYLVPNIIYSGTVTGAPWSARNLNGYMEGYLVYRDATKTELLACSAAATGEITIPNSVTSIEQSTFSGCSSLTSITIPNNVTSIGGSAFWGCISLTTITIPNSVTSIGEDAFHGCRSLEDIFVPCGELERFTQMFNDSYNSDYSDKLKIASSPHTLTIKDTKYGSVSVPDYNGCDESVMITAIPDPYCRFVKWSDGNTDNPRPVYLTEDITLEALFVYTLTDKCGKDYLLTWTLDTLKMAMDITGKGSLSDNYTYHTTFATLTIGNEVTTIGANAFSDCDNLQYLTLGSSVRVIESGAFACSDIKTITCYSKRPPTVNNDAFCNLDYETIIYVPKDYLENYQMHAFWGMFDVRPIGASGTETDKVKVEPAETTATVAWPTISGAGSYELVIRDKDGNALCTLVFNAQGQLTSIDFAAAAASARDRSNVAAMAQGAGFAFTVTGLESGTMYKYSFITKNASGAVIDTKTGAFTTQSPTALEDIMDDASSSVRKVLQNGRLYILRDGKAYTATGAEVK